MIPPTPGREPGETFLEYQARLRLFAMEHNPSTPEPQKHKINWIVADGPVPNPSQMKPLDGSYAVIAAMEIIRTHQEKRT